MFQECYNFPFKNKSSRENLISLRFSCDSFRLLMIISRVSKIRDNSLYQENKMIFY